MRSPLFVVTGSEGFIGSWVTQALLQEHPAAQVVGVGRCARECTAKGREGYEYVQCDVRDASALRRKLPADVQVVIHLAADGRTRLQSSDRGGQFDANLVGTNAVASYAAGTSADLLIFASSVYVYSGTPELPFREERVTFPQEHLGATKLAAEAMLCARARAGEFQVGSLRLFTTYGPGSKAHQFLPEAIRKLGGPGETAQFGAPNVLRDFVFVEDVARAFVRASSLAECTTEAFVELNVGSGNGTSIQEVVAILARLLGSGKEIKFGPAVEAEPGAARDHCADISRISALLGWSPQITLEEGLSRLIMSG
jgi:UDP-glucose 4-epimerase